ncbi:MULTISPECIES: GntR family transcriptional regulator [Modicisalibacter]|uniref:GntR family transcriptional regulator n=1 Tax=Modicisalibacter TaxID=574347 RepID=UPI00100BD4F9|nr:MULTISPECIES: GntR family transcriptional regulator [Halomonadaceae]MBZ9558736.1 GntR family transcriptional regulator [Modicisalibacter sp. R2A 31.J]MBZ9575373.1 GntR family transcriptional regulator [Modicisalibacter sp. MOD 31.J]
MSERQQAPGNASAAAHGEPAKRRRGKNGDGAQRHDAIYRTISDAIIEHRLRPGARLREDALAEVFGVSRTGIRKILQRLAHEHLVTLTPRRGASVTRPTAEEARDVFAARQMVECGIMEAVARRITANDVRHLRDLAGRERQALRGGEQSTAIKLSAAFHEYLAQLSGNATLAEFIGRLCSRSSLILAVYGSAGHLGCESHDHDELIKHLEARRGERATAFMGRHLKAIEASLSIEEEQEETPDLRQIFAL